jgi:hypothetical protein
VSWAIGYDSHWERDIGYGVPAFCDHPDCVNEIDRGLAYVCGGEPYGGDRGCGLYFCGNHLSADATYKQVCNRCLRHRPAYKRIAAEHPRWLYHKLTDESWQAWRDEHTNDVTTLALALLEYGFVPNDGADALFGFDPQGR